MTKLKSDTALRWIGGVLSAKPVALIVEDDELIGTLLAEMLADMGFAVCAIERTQAGAVEAASRYRPDLIIVDVRLGRGSGIAAMTEIQLHAPVAHVFMSGDRRLVETQLAPTLMKPFTLKQLSEAIRLALRTPETSFKEVGGPVPGPPHPPSPS
jgi:DNA-binding response OmpR family regulator